MISARSAAAARFRIAPWCPRVTSIIYQSLHAARYIHERSETARCAARAPPRRRFEASGRGARFSKLRVFAKHRRRSTETITGPHNEVEGEICAVFVIANLNGPRLRERPQTAPEVSEQLPRTSRVAAAVPPRAPTKIIFLIKKTQVRKSLAIGRPIGRSTSEIFHRTGQISPMLLGTPATRPEF